MPSPGSHRRRGTDRRRTRLVAPVAAACTILLAVVVAAAGTTPAIADTTSAGATTTKPTRAAAATVHETAVPKAGAWSTFFAEATGPDGLPWFLGTDGTVARRTADGTVDSFRVVGPSAKDGGWTLIGAATTADALWTADRADESVRRITTFGQTKRYPVGATPAGVLIAGSTGEWVPTDEATIVHLHADGTTTSIPFRSNTPGDTRGVAAVTDADGTLHFIVPSQPWLWTVTTSDVISRVELPDGIAATAIAATSTSGSEGLFVGLADGSVATTTTAGQITARATNPSANAVIDQIVAADGIAWFRETIAKKSAAVGYVDAGGMHVVETTKIRAGQPTTIAFGPAGVVVGWAGYSTAARTGIEVFAADGTRTFHATAFRSGGASAPASLSADEAPSFGTADGHIGVVGDVAVTRLAGANRWETQVAAVRRAYPKGAEDVLVASANAYPDALAAAPAAAHAGSPLLLVPSGSIPAQVTAELRSLGAKRVVIVGGTDVVSAAAAEQLGAVVGSGNVRRLGGSDRAQTSELVAKWGFGLGGATKAVVVDGSSASDTLAASGAIGRDGPVLLVDGDTGRPDPGTAKTLRSLGVTDVYVAGGRDVVPSTITAPLRAVAKVHRVAGANRAATASALATTLRPSATTAVLATAAAMPDALTGAVLAARSDAPLLLTSGSCVPASTLATLGSMGASSVTLLGGALGAQLDTLPSCSASTYRIPS